MRPQSSTFRFVAKWQMRQQTASEVGHQSVRGLSIMESTLRGPQLFLFFQPIASKLESGRFLPTALHPCPTLSRVAVYTSGPRTFNVIQPLLLLLLYISNHYLNFRFDLFVILAA